MSITAELHSGTLHLSDQEFLDAFESCELSGASFQHADHIRLARIYVLRLGAKAPDATRSAIRRYAAHLGVDTKYHETITLAWMRLVTAAVDLTDGTKDGSAEDFVRFASANPHLFDKNTLAEYYSTGRLFSDAARQEWLSPDIRSLPLPK